jgi:CheY-like chemotaxis protein
VTVLVVDNHAQLRQTAARLLGFLGHATLEAADAAEAEALLQGGAAEIEVVLLDLHLGGTDGGTLARRLEELRPGLRVLFMSGDGPEVFAASGLAGPRRRFVEKPFTLQSLAAALTALTSAP